MMYTSLVAKVIGLKQDKYHTRQQDTLNVAIWVDACEYIKQRSL